MALFADNVECLRMELLPQMIRKERALKQWIRIQTNSHPRVPTKSYIIITRVKTTRSALVAGREAPDPMQSGDPKRLEGRRRCARTERPCSGIAIMVASLR
jgi:hypothetical protein